MNERQRMIAAEIADGLTRLQQMVDERDLLAGGDLAHELLVKTRQAGIRSAFFLWLRSVLADYGGDFSSALTLIEEAVTLDPLALPIRHSLRVITRNARAALSDPTRAADEPNTPELWSLLMRAGEADDGCHLALARYRLAQNNALEAMRLVDAVTALSPDSREAWLLKSAIAASLGDHQLVARAAAEAAVLDDGASVPFATRPMAQS